MADLVTRLRLDNKQFDENLRRSKQSLDGFKNIGKSVQGNFSSLLGTLKGFAAPLMAVTTAGTAFNKLLRSSQTATDGLDANLRALSSTVDSFFSALSLGDFSVFDKGIVNLINKAKEANAALDQLGNTVISYEYFSNKNMSEFQEQILIYRDKTKTKEERDQALANAKAIFDKQNEYVETLRDKSIDAIKKVATESSVLSPDQITFEDVERVLEIDVRADSDEAHADLDKLYDDFLAIRNKVMEANNNPIDVVIDKETGVTRRMDNYDMVKVNKEMEQYIEQYKDAILYHEILVKKTGENGDYDKWLKDLVAVATKVNQAELAISSMGRRLISSQNSALNGKLTSSSDEAKNKLKKELTDIQNQISDIEAKIQFTTDPKSKKELETQLSKLKDKEIDIKIKLNIPDEDTIADLETRRNKIILRLSYESDPQKQAALYKELNAITNKIRIIKFKYETLGHKPSLATMDEIAGPDFSKAGNKAPKVYKKEIKPINSKQIDLADEYNKALNGIASTLTSVTNLTNKGAAAWLSYGANILTAVGQGLPAIISLFGAKKLDTAATNEQTTAEAVQAGATVASETTSTTAVVTGTATRIAAKQAETAANTTTAATGAAASQAGIPIVGPILAIAAIAAILAAIAAIPTFATGGIFESPLTTGDRNLARLNGGEMILNKGQQYNLFQLLDHGGPMNTNKGSVEFKIHGKELVGVLSNYENKMSKIR